MAVCGKCIHKNVCGFCKEMGFENVVRANDFNCKDYISTDDVAEVKNGTWIDDIQKFTSPAGVTQKYLCGYKCSLCGRSERIKEPYCNCGAKMDGG